MNWAGGMIWPVTPGHLAMKTFRYADANRLVIIGSVARPLLVFKVTFSAKLRDLFRDPSLYHCLSINKIEIKKDKNGLYSYLWALAIKTILKNDSFSIIIKSMRYFLGSIRVRR